MRFTVLASFIAALAVLSVTAGPAQASVITTGDVAPGGAATQPEANRMHNGPPRNDRSVSHRTAHNACAGSVA